MNYKETIDYLFSQLPIFQRMGKAAYKADLINTNLLDEHLKHPHKHYKIVHVAGTNGKGSVSHMTASVLQEAGYKTGLYTSPHYLDFRERIRVNGEMISEDFVVKFVEENKNYIEKISPSFFELTMVMALDYFREEQVDIAVLEVGMGGRLDSTNIVTPLVSVITNIGHDHQQFLGDTLAKIAAEKAGIIKDEVPVVIGETQEQTEAIFRRFAKEKKSKIYFADQEMQISYSMLSINQKQLVNVEDKKGEPLYKELKLDLLGQYQLKNVKATLQVLHLLRNEIDISDKSIYSGLENTMKNTGLMGRFMTLGNNPRIICDAAHNFEGLAILFEQVAYIPHKRLHIVVGFVNDKDIDSLLDLFPKDANYFFTKADIPRALDELKVKNKFEGHSIAGNVFENVEQALINVLKEAEREDFILICGSSFIVAEAIGYFASKRLIK